MLEVMSSVGSHIGQFIERRRAEAALRDSEQRFRLMADAVPSIIWTAAPDGTITYANERWFEYCGLTPEQNAGGWPELVLPPRGRRALHVAPGGGAADGTPYEVEARYRRHDGVYRWFVTRAVPVRNAGAASSNGSVLFTFNLALQQPCGTNGHNPFHFFFHDSSEV